MNNNIIQSLLLGFYASQKPSQTKEEGDFTQAFEIMLREPLMAPFLSELHAQGYVDQRGSLTKHGVITVKKIQGKTRNPKQLNFQRLCNNSTPGYNAALGLTALNRMIQQAEEGIFQKVNEELFESLAQLRDNLDTFFNSIDIESIEEVVHEEEAISE
jgi:hypothetical protein